MEKLENLAQILAQAARMGSQSHHLKHLGCNRLVADMNDIGHDCHCEVCGQAMRQQPESMTEAGARAILVNHINHRTGNMPRGMWEPGDTCIRLDDPFTADELEALAWWMRNMGEKP